MAHPYQDAANGCVLSLKPFADSVTVLFRYASAGPLESSVFVSAPLISDAPVQRALGRHSDALAISYTSGGTTLVGIHLHRSFDYCEDESFCRKQGMPFPSIILLSQSTVPHREVE